MKWPRGRCNGRRITGIEFKITVDVLDWRIIPQFHWQFGTIYLHWLCFRTWTSANYEF